MHILVVEDDSLVRDAVCRALTQHGYNVDHVASAEAAETAMLGDKFDLALVDIGLPGEDGLQLVRKWRLRSRAIPVLMLTARDGLSDRVNALDLGADDYLTKPFEIAELVARCRALIRRANSVASTQLKLGGLLLDMAHTQASKEGAPLDLTRREWSILECLALNAGNIVSKDKLMSTIANWDEQLTPNAIEVYVSRLRAKLVGAVAIHTIRGLGYRLDEVRSSEGKTPELRSS